MLKFGLGLGTACGTAAALHYNNWDWGALGVIRFGRAAVTVGKIIIDYKFTLHNVDAKSDQYQPLKSQVHSRSASRLLHLCCTNGGAFVKVGQHLGALNYLLPAEYINTLRILHSQAPKSSLEDVFFVIKEDLGQEPSELFSSFDPEPLGAASLAQVHKAVLKDGTTVAVKVQHKLVKATSFIDMKTMEILVHTAAWMFPEFQFLWLAEETKKNLPIELDFANEGKNAERVKKMFGHYRWFKVPEIYWQYSTSRVLTMEYCQGGQVNDKEYIKEHKIPVHEVTRKLGQLYSEMIFIHGYVHCDPHPGNILVDNSTGNLKLILLDHGLYSSLTDSFRLKYADMWLAILKADTQAIEQHAKSLGIEGNLHVILTSMMTARTWKAIKAGIDKHSISDDENKQIRLTVGTHFDKISEILNLVPREMLLIFKTNDLLRSIEYNLDTPVNASSFITMSRCCVKAIAQHRMQSCETLAGKLRLLCHHSWTLMKISFYECYIWVQTLLTWKMLVMRKNSLTSIC